MMLFTNSNLKFLARSVHSLSNKNQKRNYLIAFTIVLQASRSLTVASFVVSSFIVTSTFADLWPESLRVSVQTSLDGLLSVLLMG